MIFIKNCLFNVIVYLRLESLFFKKQELEEIDNFFNKQDPWNYEKNADDFRRKQLIINELENYEVNSAIDIGCAEGWITQSLPAKKIVGIDISKKAIKNAKKLKRKGEYINLNINDRKDLEDKMGNEKFDLILITGVLYRHYCGHNTIKNILKISKKDSIILTSHINEWPVIRIPGLKLIKKINFPYGKYTQSLKIYRKK